MNTPSPVINYNSTPSTSSRVPHIALALATPVMWTVFAVLLIVFLMGVTSSLLGKLGIIGGPLATLYMAVIAMLLAQMFRRRRGMVVLDYVSQAVRLNLPLPQFLLSATTSERGKTARRLRNLQQAIAIGRPLTDAMNATVPELSPRILELIGAGERTGRLSQAFERLADQERKFRERRFDRRAYMLMYPALLIFFVVTIVTGEMYFVVPKFREIFNDFRTTMPPVTIQLFYISDWLGDMLGLIVGAIVIVLFVSYIGWILARAFGRPLKRSRSHIKDAFFWVLPLGNAWGRHRDMADALDVIDDGLEAGRPLNEAVGETLGLDINWILKRRFIRLHKELLNGASLGKAAENAGMPHIVASMLGTAETNGSLPEAAAFLARYYRMRFSRALILLQAAAEPAMVLCMGLLVGFVILGLFSPLTKLIASVVGMSEVL